MHQSRSVATTPLRGLSGAPAPTTAISPALPTSGGSGTVRIGGTLTGLDEGLVQHYRIAASNNFGIVYGPDQTFQVGRIYYASVVLADHPIAYWRFDEPDGSAVAYDLVGSHNGVYTNVSLGLPGHNEFDED